MSTEADHLQAALTKLDSGEDPVAVLREFAARVRAGSARACHMCGDRDAPCFRCKVGETIGEKAAFMTPFVLARVSVLVKQWATEALARRQAKKKQGGDGQ